MRRKSTKEYASKNSVYFHVETNLKEAFEDLCWEERKTLTEKMKELMESELAKKPVALEANPARIPYEQPTITNNNQTIKHSSPEVLDSFIERKLITFDYWKDFYRDINDIQRMDKHVALTTTMNQAARQKATLLKTGKYIMA